MHLSTLLIFSLLLNLPTQAMYRGFSRTRTIKIIVPAIGAGSLYIFFKNNQVFAQDNSQNNKNDIINAYNIAKLDAQKNKKFPIIISQNIDEHNYFDDIKPEKTESLLNTEKYKKEDPRKTIFARINEKWVGEIPYQIQVIVAHLVNYKNEQDVTIPNIILLYGQPGLGKTSLVKAIADELEFPLFSFSSSIFTDKYIGESPKKIRAALQKVKKSAEEFNSPSFIFIDEFDAIASSRDSNTHAEYRNIMATLLTEIEAVTNNKKIIVFAATNDFRSLDSAIKSRFSPCEIKALSTEHKAILIKKIFAQEGIIEDKIAEGFAEILQRDKNQPCGTSNYIDDALRALSNREIKRIIQFARAKQISSCRMNPNICNRHICDYLREAIIETVLSSNGKIDFTQWAKLKLKYMQDLEEKIPGYNNFIGCHNEPLKQVVSKKKERLKAKRASWCSII